MRLSPHSIGRTAIVLGLTAITTSCGLLTFDCGGPTTRETIATTTVRDLSDTLTVDPVVAVYEERDHDGSSLHQLQVGIQATNSIHYDTIPAALRPHVTGVRLALSSGMVLYHVAMTDNSSQHNGPSVLALIAVNDVDQSLFDGIRQHLLANEIFVVVESDGAVQFPRAAVRVQSSYDWRKQSCQ